MTRQPDEQDPLDVDRAVQDVLDRLLLLVDASEALSSTLDVEPRLRRLCRVLMPALADWCAIDLVRDDGRLRRAVVETRDAGPPAPEPGESLLPPVDTESEAFVAQALRAAGPLRFTFTAMPAPQDAADAVHRLELETFARLSARSAILTPLRARQRVLGVLTLVRIGQDGLDEQETLPLVQELAHRIAITMDNTRLYAAVAHTAERLQRSLLPTLPRGGPLEVAARYDPARSTAQIGGDWYDAFLLPDGALTLIIGDVTGHDLQAAVTMSQMRNMLRGIASDRREPPGKILARLDAAAALLYPHEYLSCLYALVTKPEPDGGWTMQYAAAGHPPPLLVTRQGKARMLTRGRSILLGVSPGTRRRDAAAALPPDSTVLLYTDGLIERRGEDLGDGMIRLRQRAAALAQAPLDTFCDELLAQFGQDNTDDIAMIAVRVPSRTSSLTATAE